MLESNKAIIVNGDMSGDLISPPINLLQTVLSSIQLSWTGVPVGTFTVEHSCDAGSDQLGSDVSIWTSHQNSPVASAGGPGNWIYNLVSLNIGKKWARLRFTWTSGTGTLNARFNSKGQ